jgi:hypothetical protein
MRKEGKKEARKGRGRERERRTNEEARNDDEGGWVGKVARRKEWMDE